MKKILREITLYQKQGELLLQISAVQNLIDNKYAVVMVTCIPKDKPYEYLQDIYFELLEEEIINGFMDWFSTIEEAIEDYINHFFQK